MTVSELAYQNLWLKIPQFCLTITVKFNLCAVTPFSRQYLIREILGFKGKITFVPYLKDLDISDTVHALQSFTMWYDNWMIVRQ